MSIRNKLPIVLGHLHQISKKNIQPKNAFFYPNPILGEGGGACKKKQLVTFFPHLKYTLFLAKLNGIIY